MSYIVYIPTIILLLFFLVMYYRNPYRLINGFVFDCFLATFLMVLIVFLQKYPNIICNILLFIIVAMVMIILLFGIFIVIGYLLINSIKMLKKERKSLSNSLALLLLIGIIMQILLSIYFAKYITNPVVLLLFSLFYSVEFYLIVSILSFISISVIMQFNRTKKHRDYFIVLGCGLINGHKVSPLLAGRINKAIDAFNHQKVRNKSCKIIFSGGKGSDESISEAEAMQAYAVLQGVPIEDTIIENKSVNTLENMLFSKKIMDECSLGNYSCTYVTSDYHIFRAGVYAYKAGLRKVTGLGSKTKGYYIPNAMIREYIALFVMNKKRKLFVIGFIFMIYIFIWILYMMLR